MSSASMVRMSREPTAWSGASGRSGAPGSIASLPKSWSSKFPVPRLASWPGAGFGGAASSRQPLASSESNIRARSRPEPPPASSARLACKPSRLAAMRSMVASSVAHALALRRDSEKPQPARLDWLTAFEICWRCRTIASSYLLSRAGLLPPPREAAARSASSCRQTPEAACSSVAAKPDSARAPSSAAARVSLHRRPIRNSDCLVRCERYRVCG